MNNPNDIDKLIDSLNKPRKLDKLDRPETPKTDRCCDDNNSGIRL